MTRKIWERDIKDGIEDAGDSIKDNAEKATEDR